MMPDEIDPARDLGFIQDKQFICEPQGFLTPCNTARDLCRAVIPHGDKLYDILDRYDNVTSYVLNRDDTGHSGDVMRLISPFLKAFGATDYSIQRFYDSSLKMMPGAENAMRYIVSQMPTFMETAMYDQAANTLCNRLSLPRSMVGATTIDLDGTEMTPKECRDLRGMATDITGLKLPRDKYELNVPLELSAAEVDMVSALDDIFTRKLQSTAAFDMIQNMMSIGANEKAYALLDIRKTTQVDLDGTMYVGGEIIDYQVMDLVKDGSGLSVSFNGSEFAVHGCNVAVMSDDCTVVSFLASVFYDTGIQGVFDMVENWNRKFLCETNVPDRNALNAMLAKHPKNLPTVVRVTKDNVSEIAAKSDAYRKKAIRKAEKSTASEI